MCVQYGTFLLCSHFHSSACQSCCLPKGCDVCQRNLSAVKVLKKVGHFCLIADMGPVWHSVAVESSKVYFLTFGASSVNSVCLMNHVTLPFCEQRLSSVFFHSRVGQLCKSAMSYSAFNCSVHSHEMWHKLFGCHLNYLYTPLLDVKIGLLCSAAKQIFHSRRLKLNNMRTKWKSRQTCVSVRAVDKTISIIHCFTVLVPYS